MAKPTTPTEASSPEATPANATSVLPGTEQPQASEPKKKKKKYSNIFLRTVQELDSGLTKSVRKVAQAVSDGLDEYEARRTESAGAKQDGVLRDMLRNQSKALRKGLPVAAEAPADFLDAVADLKVVRRFSSGKGRGK